MKILLEWLKDYVPVDVPVDKLAEDLHMAGLAVEAVEEAPNGAGPIIELEITTNRPDLLSHYGVAREVSALYQRGLKKIDPKPAEAADEAGAAAGIEIQEPDLCHRYAGLVLRNIKVQPSPEWLRKRLEACGVQSINNIVDVSNYVLLELGHPTHAFDLDKLAGKRIIVRRAGEGEKLTTLDGVNRTLNTENLVIADAERPVALAGIMGGQDSEIGFATKNILLESAWFEPVITRRAAKRLGLRTEASYRFERGCDVEAPVRAARRCAEMILDLAGGELLSGVIDIYPTKWVKPEVVLRAREITRHLGAPVPDKDVEHILASLGFDAGKNEQGWSVTVPPWRRDVFREIDLIEEIARLHGYDKFPSTIPVVRAPASKPPHAAPREQLRQRLEGMGFDEAVSLSLANPDEAAAFLPGGELVPIANPLSRENSVLRPTGYLSLVKALARNINRGQRDLRFYEIGKGYSADGGKVAEHRILTLAITGRVREQSVQDAARPSDLFALIGAAEAVLELFDLPPLERRASQLAWFAPGEQTLIAAGGKGVCEVGKLSTKLTKQFKLRQDAWLAEFDLETLYAAGLRPRSHRALSRYQAVERDFSLLLDASVPFGKVRATVERIDIPEMISVAAVDRFTGQSVPEGKVSLLLRVTFQSTERTLKEEEIRKFSDRIIKALEKETGATLRA